MTVHDRESGFTLIEVSVAAILVVAFALGFASSFGSAFGAARGNIVRQQATTVLSQELEYARALTWSELALTYVNPAAPMLDSTGTKLVGAEAGFSGDETLVVLDTGLVTPFRYYDIDGSRYEVYRYVSHVPGGPRRFVAWISWTGDEGTHTLLASTLITEVTARANGAHMVTLPDGSQVTTSSSSTSSTTTTSTTTTSTTTTSTTTTTLPGLVIESLTLEFSKLQNKQTATVLVDFASGGNANGVVVVGTWSVTPAEPGYPFQSTQITAGAGKATFVHIDGHPNGATVQFCVTDLVLAGYQYTGGTQCVSKVW